MKESFYFSHDYDAYSDPKIQAMIGEYGAVGYGLFWRIIEMLHSDKDHQLMKKKYIYSAIARQLNLDSEVVEKFLFDCVNDFELLNENNECFWSNRVNQNFEIREKIKEERSKAGKKGMEKRWKKTSKDTKNKDLITNDNPVITNDNKTITPQYQNITNNNKGKEKKGKEKKEKERESEREKNENSHTLKINNFIEEKLTNIRDKLGYLNNIQVESYLKEYEAKELVQILAEIEDRLKQGHKYTTLTTTINKFLDAKYRKTG